MMLLLLTLWAHAADPIDLNQATADELAALDGLGPLKAQAIVADREAHGLFSHVNTLERVPGIGAATLANLRGRVVASAPPPVTQPALDLNLVSSQELADLPGVGLSQALRILADRDEQGPFERCEDVERVEGVGPATTAVVLRACRDGQQAATGH